MYWVLPLDPKHFTCIVSCDTTIQSVIPNRRWEELRLKKREVTTQSWYWRCCCHSSEGPSRNKILSERIRISNSNREEWPGQGRFWSILAWATQPTTWIPWDRDGNLSLSVNISEVWVPQPAVDMQLPSSKNKTPKISHISRLELLRHTNISSSDTCSWCGKQKRERKRERMANKRRGFKKVGKKREIPN